MDEDLTHADVLKNLVQQWTPPPASPDLDQRMLAAYRGRLRGWKRWARARVAVPVPVLAASFLLVLAAGLWLAAVARREPRPAIRWQPVEQPVLRVIPASGGTQ